MNIRVFQQRSAQIAVFVVATLTIAATLHKYALGVDHLNNLRIFCTAFAHLLHGVNLYAPAPSEYADVFKYSPTFALCMAPFAALPLVWSALAWNCLNAGVFVLGVLRLSSVQQAGRPNVHSLILWITLVELLTALQNFQSNALLAGLALLTIAAFERYKPVQAALYLALAFHVKLFGIALAVIAVLYRRNGRFSMALLGWLLVLTALPLLVIPPESLATQYVNWASLLASDHEASYGLSAMRLIQPVLPTPMTVSVVQVASLLLTYLPVLFAGWLKRWFELPSRQNPRPPAGSNARLLVLTGASILLWMVVFNHKAESPTFIIAMTGIALWYAVSARGLTERVVLWFAIIGTSLSVTDIFPAVVREEVFVRYSVKVIPCLLIWCLVQLQTWQLVVAMVRVRSQARMIAKTDGTEFEH
jgi:Glycosyltransferase family 87